MLTQIVRDLRYGFRTLLKRPGFTAAREMAAMRRMINEQLGKIQNLKPKPGRAINCSTCHRGSIDPLAAEH